METVSWSHLISVGHDDLDDEHRILVSYINECIALSQSKDQGDRIISTVVRLIVFTDQHFANEERIMKQFGYPDTDEHSAAHKQAMQQIHRFALRTNGTTLCYNIGSYLTNWFFTHATTHDRKLGEWLARKCPDVPMAYECLGSERQKA